MTFSSSRDFDCVATGKQILPIFKLEDNKDEETLVFKFVAFNSASEENRFSLLSSMSRY